MIEVFTSMHLELSADLSDSCQRQEDPLRDQASFEGALEWSIYFPLFRMLLFSRANLESKQYGSCYPELHIHASAAEMELIDSLRILRLKPRTS